MIRREEEVEDKGEETGRGGGGWVSEVCTTGLDNKDKAVRLKTVGE